MDNNTPQITPLTLSELVPAQTLAKALLEAEEALRGLYITYQDDMSAAGIYTKKRVLFVKSGQALAQIQRIKKGEIPADKYLPAPKEDVERALDALQRVQDWQEGKGGMLPYDFIFGTDKRDTPENKGHLETIRRVLLANAGRKE